MYKIKDEFTTRDGRWIADGKEYSISQEMIDKYQNNFPEKGAATNLFGRIEGGSADTILFFTRDHGVPDQKIPVGPSGWANLAIEHGSGYNPERGEEGWWNIQVYDAPSEVARNVGLPHSWHVSTFVVFEWEEEETGPVDPGKQLTSVLYLYSDGSYEQRNG